MAAEALASGRSWQGQIKGIGPAWPSEASLRFFRIRAHFSAQRRDKTTGERHAIRKGEAGLRDSLGLPLWGDYTHFILANEHGDTFPPPLSHNRMPSPLSKPTFRNLSKLPSGLYLLSVLFP